MSHSSILLLYCGLSGVGGKIKMAQMAFCAIFSLHKCAVFNGMKQP
jgi:hypothetical protein